MHSTSGLGHVEMRRPSGHSAAGEVREPVWLRGGWGGRGDGSTSGSSELSPKEAHWHGQCGRRRGVRRSTRACGSRGCVLSREEVRPEELGSVEWTPCAAGAGLVPGAGRTHPSGAWDFFFFHYWDLEAGSSAEREWGGGWTFTGSRDEKQMESEWAGEERGWSGRHWDGRLWMQESTSLTPAQFIPPSLSLVRACWVRALPTAPGAPSPRSTSLLDPGPAASLPSSLGSGIVFIVTSALDHTVHTRKLLAPHPRAPLAVLFSTLIPFWHIMSLIAFIISCSLLCALPRHPPTLDA